MTQEEILNLKENDIVYGVTDNNSVQRLNFSSRNGGWVYTRQLAQSFSLGTIFLNKLHAYNRAIELENKKLEHLIDEEDNIHYAIKECHSNIEKLTNKSLEPEFEVKAH